MKLISSKFTAKAMAMVALVSLSSAAFAASTIWNLNSTCGATNTNLGTTEQCTGGGPNLSALSNGQGTAASPTATNSATNFAAADVYNWSGAGIGVVANNVAGANNENAGATGPHAIDNAFGIDALLLDFGTKVNMSSLTVGWNATTSPCTSQNNDTSASGTPCNGTGGSGTNVTYKDSDLSVFAWTGANPPTGSPSTLASLGWTLIGNFANVTGAQSLGSPTIYASYWLVSAYASAYCTTGCTDVGGTGTTGLNQGNDAFKLSSVTTSPQQVPEPGSLILLGAGLIGLVASRRRKQAVM